MTTSIDTSTESRETHRGYGSALAQVEPGGAEYIPVAERHGRPIQLLWTFSAPNFEFATVAVGILGPLAFGMSFWDTFWAIILGCSLAAVPHGVLAGWGPRLGLPQMAIGRSAFGYLGNILPASLNTVIAGIGWFAVNSVSGALALHALAPGLSPEMSLLIVLVAEIGVAYFGHNLVQALERYAGPVLGVIFLAASAVAIFHVDPGFPADPIPGAFTIETAAVFGFAVGWAPFASDYSRYFSPTTNRSVVALWAGGGIMLACVPLMIAGAAVVTAGQDAFDPTAFTDLLPGWFGVLVLSAVVLGSVCANAMNMYSGSVSFATLGIKLPGKRGRAVAALALGVAGGVASFIAIQDAGAAFTNFLLVISYIIGPWLGIVFTDRLLHRPASRLDFVLDPRAVNVAGPIAYIVAGFISIVLFSNQALFVGYVAAAFPQLGDLTCLVGFVLGAVFYAIIFRLLPPAIAARTGAIDVLDTAEAPA